MQGSEEGKEEEERSLNKSNTSASPSLTFFSSVISSLSHSSFSAPYTGIFTPTVITNNDMDGLWTLILDYRSNEKDLDGCLEVLELLRDHSIPPNVLHWDKLFTTAISVKLKRKGTKYYISRSNLITGLTELLNVMIEKDNLVPSVTIFKKCLRYFADSDDVKGVMKILKIMKYYDIDIRDEIYRETYRELNQMESYDLVIDYINSKK